MNKYLLIVILLMTFTEVNAKKVKFAVDMTGQPVNITGVHVSGDFQEEAGYEGGDWQSNTTVMTQEGGTAIYSVIVDIPAFAKYEYKFINGDQWYEVEFVPQESRVGYDYDDNRWVYIDSLYNDTTNIPAVMFSGNAPVGFYLLRLKVDMGQQGMIDPAGVHVAGDFQDWDPASAILYSFGNDVFEQILYIEIWTGDTECEYRFVNGNTEAGYETVPVDCSVNGNRYMVLPKDTVVETVCFSECTYCQYEGADESPSALEPRLYPNPCKENAILEFNDDEISHNVIVTDLLGNQVKYFPDNTMKSLVIARDKLPSGIYFVKISSGKHWLSTLRLVISR
jgi:hypothetical protein